MKNLISLFVLAAFLFIPTTARSETKSVTINVSVNVHPVFELNVSGPAGGNIQFGDIQQKADGDVVIEAPEVVLHARTNLGKPYQITQELIEPLANEQNAQFSKEDFTVDMENGGSRERTVSGPVSTEASTLFVSDSGLEKTLNARYKLRVRPEQPAGLYQAKLVYTITSL